jgi:hypothetical protein
MCGICPCSNCTPDAPAVVARPVAWLLLAAALVAVCHAVWTFVASIIVALMVVTLAVLAALVTFVVRQLRAPGRRQELMHEVARGHVDRRLDLAEGEQRFLVGQVVTVELGGDIHNGLQVGTDELSWVSHDLTLRRRLLPGQKLDETGRPTHLALEGGQGA